MKILIGKHSGNINRGVKIHSVQRASVHIPWPTENLTHPSTHPPWDESIFTGCMCLTLHSTRNCTSTLSTVYQNSKLAMRTPPKLHQLWDSSCLAIFLGSHDSSTSCLTSGAYSTWVEWLHGNHWLQFPMTSLATFNRMCALASFLPGDKGFAHSLILLGPETYICQNEWARSPFLK
jgi:hypothetical protein